VRGRDIQPEKKAFVTGGRRSPPPPPKQVWGPPLLLKQARIRRYRRRSRHTDPRVQLGPNKDRPAGTSVLEHWPHQREKRVCNVNGSSTLCTCADKLKAVRRPNEKTIINQGLAHTGTQRGGGSVTQPEPGAPGNN